MTTIIENDSFGPATLLTAIVLAGLIAASAWVINTNGAFDSRTTAIEPQTVIMSVPASTPDSEKAAQ